MGCYSYSQSCICLMWSSMYGSHMTIAFYIHVEGYKEKHREYRKDNFLNDKTLSLFSSSYIGSSLLSSYLPWLFLPLPASYFMSSGLAIGALLKCAQPPVD